MNEPNHEKIPEEKPLSRAIQSQKEDLYRKIPLTLKQVDTILVIAFAALAVVIVLIILEAAGIFEL